MVMRNLILVMALVFSVSLLAQNTTQEEKVATVKDFCSGLDINGKVLYADRAAFIKNTCGNNTNSENSMCSWYSIDKDGEVFIAEDKLETVRSLCKQYFINTSPTEQVASFIYTLISSYRRPIGGSR